MTTWRDHLVSGLRAFLSLFVWRANGANLAILSTMPVHKRSRPHCHSVHHRGGSLGDNKILDNCYVVVHDTLLYFLIGAGIAAEVIRSILVVRIPHDKTDFSR